MQPEVFGGKAEGGGCKQKSGISEKRNERCGAGGGNTFEGTGAAKGNRHDRGLAQSHHCVADQADGPA